MQTKTVVKNASIANAKAIVIETAGAEVAHLKEQLEYARLVDNESEAAKLEAAVKEATRSKLRALASGAVVVHRHGKAFPAGADAGLPIRRLPMT